jgi:hypothetical protein
MAVALLTFALAELLFRIALLWQQVAAAAVHRVHHGRLTKVVPVVLPTVVQVPDAVVLRLQVQTKVTVARVDTIAADAETTLSPVLLDRVEKAQTHAVLMVPEAAAAAAITVAAVVTHAAPVAPVVVALHISAV